MPEITDAEPLWWGRGSNICIGVQPATYLYPFHKLFMGNGKTGERTECMLLADDQLRKLGMFLIDLADGREHKNG